MDAWPAGHFGRGRGAGQRLARASRSSGRRPGDSEWAHPVDGLIVLVDLNTLEVLRVDDHGVVPIPPERGNFDAAAAAPLRDDIAPLEITQPEGPGFTRRGPCADAGSAGGCTSGFTPARGAGAEPASATRTAAACARSCTAPRCRRWSCPTATPARPTTSRTRSTPARTASALAASPLTRGCDCLGEIVYLDAVVSDADGAPVTIPNAICMHEEDYGVLWRHIEWRDGSGEVRRSRRLVISSFSAIGNYDYGFFWYLYQDGTIEFEVKLTGVLSTGAVAPGRAARARHAGGARA